LLLRNAPRTSRKLPKRRSNKLKPRKTPKNALKLQEKKLVKLKLLPTKSLKKRLVQPK
jgi:hypothetical protein